MGLKDNSGKSFIKLADHKGHIFLIDYKGYEPTGGYKGKPGVKLDLTVFSPDDLTEPAATYSNEVIDRGYIVAQFTGGKTGEGAAEVGDTVIKKLGQLPGQNGNNPAWKFFGVSDEQYEAVAAYYQAREDRRLAAADDVPDYLR